VVQQQYLQAPLASLAGAKQAGGTGTNHYDIKFMRQINLWSIQDGHEQL
jgi:hypothetical protein